MRLRMIFMLLGSLIFFGLIFGYKAIGNYFMNDFFDNMPEPTVTVTAAEVQSDEWAQDLSVVGTFSAVHGVTLASQMSGILTEIYFANGERVEQGQPLFKLDTEIDEANLARLRAALRVAETEARRLERLGHTQNIAESELERALSEEEQARAAVQAQEALIRQKLIRAPFGGVTGLRRVNQGEFIHVGTELVTLESFSPIFLNFSLPEQNISRIRVGQPISVRVDALAGDAFPGTITAIEPRIHVSTRSIQVQATFVNTDELLRPGMFGRAQLTFGEPRPVRVIPRTAVQFNPFGQLVYVIEQDSGEMRVRQRLIRTGQTQGDLIEIIEGLEFGERIVTSGLLKLRNNARVVITDDQDVQPPDERQPQPENR